METDDPIIDEVRKIRDQHAVQFDYDLDAIVADLKERERASGREYVNYPPVNPEPLRSARNPNSDP